MKQNHDTPYKLTSLNDGTNIVKITLFSSSVIFLYWINIHHVTSKHTVEAKYNSYQPLVEKHHGTAVTLFCFSESVSH